MKRTFILSLFVLGFSSLVSQVVVIRELAVNFYGNEFFIGWVLFAWLFWTAAGSIFEGKFSQPPRKTCDALWFCHVLVALLFPVILTLIRSGKLLLGTPAGAMPDLFSALIFSFLALGPFCAVLGFQFASAVRGWTLQEAAAGSCAVTGRSYLYETIGFIAGGILFSYVFVFANEFKIAAGVAALNLTSAGLLIHGFRKTKQKFLGIFCVLAALVSLLIPLNAGTFQQQTSSWRFPQETLVDSENTVHGNIAVTWIRGQYNFYQNGLLLGAGDEKLANEYLVHFSMLFHPAPKIVLLLGTGFNGALREILKYASEKVTVVELDPRQIHMAKKYISRGLCRRLDDKRVRIWLGDSWSFLRTDRETFDVVILNTPGPSTVLMNRQFTTEFFKQVKARLAPGGIVATHLKFAPDFVTLELENLAASIYKTLKRFFPNVLVLPEDTLYMVASMAPLTQDPEVLVRRMQARGLKNAFVSPAYLKYRLTNDRVAKVRDLLEVNRRARLNKDLRPSGYYYDFLYWVSSFDPNLAKVFAWPLKIPFVALAGGLVLGMFLWRIISRGRSLAAMAMATGGFSLMSAEIILIYGFQIFYGNLYYRIAWIITAFMVGMGIGTWAGNRRESAVVRSVLGGLHLGAAFYFLLLSVLWWMMARHSMAMTGWAEALFLAGAVMIGGLVGFEFPCAIYYAVHEPGAKEEKTGSIYAADLLGACLGALLTAGFLIPIWGIYRTFLLLIILNTTTSLFFYFPKTKRI